MLNREVDSNLHAATLRNVLQNKSYSMSRQIDFLNAIIFIDYVLIENNGDDIYQSSKMFDFLSVVYKTVIEIPS